MIIQENELSDLLEALNLKENGPNSSENKYAQLAEKSINSFQDYIDKRNRLSSPRRFRLVFTFMEHRLGKLLALDWRLQAFHVH